MPMTAERESMTLQEWALRPCGRGASRRGPQAGASHARPTPDPEVAKRRKFTAQSTAQEAESCTQPGERAGLYSSHLIMAQVAREGQAASIQGLTPSKRGRKLVPCRNPASARCCAKHWLPRRKCDGRLGLLERTRRDRLQPSGNPHRVGPTGGLHGAIQMGEHDARQHQVRDHRDLSHRPDHAGRYLARAPGATTGAINSKP